MTAPVVLHAAWSGERLCLWGEDPATDAGASAEPDSGPRPHPFAATHATLRSLLTDLGEGVESSIVLRLPARHGVPGASPGAEGVAAQAAAAGRELAEFRAPCLLVEGGRCAEILERITEPEWSDARAGDRPRDAITGPSVEFFAAAARLARHLLVQERFVPALEQVTGGGVRARWQPWMSDEATAGRLAGLVRAMPPVARASSDRFGHDPAAIVESFVGVLLDSSCREAFRAEDLFSAVSERDPESDPHVAWLSGLLGESSDVRGSAGARQDLVRRVRLWIGGLEERGASAAWRLGLRLSEPDLVMAGDVGEEPEPDSPSWNLSFHLQAVDRPSLELEARDIWLLPGHSVTVGGRRVENPQEILLGELGRASKIYARLEHALADARPDGLGLTTRQAYEFLREFRPLLVEQGFGVEAPGWWDSPSARLGVKLRLQSPEALPDTRDGAGANSAAGSRFGLGTLVKYRWDIAVGDLSLTLKEFEELAARRTPLVRINGRWVEVRPEDVQAAVKFLRDNPGGELKVADAMRMAYGADLKHTGLPVVGLEATGWLAGLLGGEQAATQLEILPAPATFQGTLRPYQLRGVSWLEFLERLGLGACLADDMGLGKTIQLLALLAHEREVAAAAPGGPEFVGPTLLIVPMSVVGNWIHETRRFCPHLKVLVQHGPERPQGDDLVARGAASDLVLTTYALAHRDAETLSRVAWSRLVLDEAQYIKNPTAKQSRAVRSIPAERRVALTGTPVENRLSELWSIMDFLNPGYLGAASAFRTRFAVPIERYRDKGRAEQLRALIRPFVLRRLKSDPTVVADLPEKIEGREFCHLTSEQASLYESCVRRMLGEVERAEGIHRRGLVLSALIRLKQVCNHPAQMLREHAEGGGAAVGSDLAHAVDPRRSGKCVRLLEMLEEVLAEGDQALVFTQFRQMGHLLQHMIRRRFEREVLFLHGGTNQQQRQGIVESFQRADGTNPVLILSLRAGGVGLNLTAGTHVFHFDRWWNPAVENQATDRAYRIGQTRTVQVHKFVVRGTLEERIDEMIEQKTELATNIIGSGERWLTELTTTQLKDILTLRSDAVGDEA